VFSEPSDQSQIVSDAVLGAVFNKGSSQGKWTEVIFPDARRGFLQTKKLTTFYTARNTSNLNRDKIINWSKQMMGIPYLWGGHSTKGFDCSGFTSTVYLTQGYQLPRDAYMQAELGEKIIPAQDYSNIKPGDLIFFGSADRITHVGICLGGSHYIHESGDVHISSLDPDDQLYDSYRKSTFRFIKRIISN
jgi:cell wall-associated NlpC family hydrolase